MKENHIPDNLGVGLSLSNSFQVSRKILFGIAANGSALFSLGWLTMHFNVGTENFEA